MHLLVGSGVRRVCVPVYGHKERATNPVSYSHRKTKRLITRCIAIKNYTAFEAPHSIGHTIFLTFSFQILSERAAFNETYENR